MNAPLKTILREEAIRLMALIGLVIFGAFPVANALDVEVAKVAMVTLPLPFLIFSISVWIRVRTGKKFQVSTRQGWLIMTIAGYLLLISLATFLTVIRYMTLSQLMVLIAAGGLMTGLFAWLGPRMMRLQ